MLLWCDAEQGGRRYHEWGSCSAFLRSAFLRARRNTDFDYNATGSADVSTCSPGYHEGNRTAR
jgi:hypothetical protein